MRNLSGRARVAVTGMVLAFGLSPPVSALAGAVTIWETGFETGFPPEISVIGNWSVITSSAAAHSGAKGADIVGPNGRSDDPFGDALMVTVDARGYRGLSLGFWSKVRGELESEDDLTVQWSTDGVTWDDLISFTTASTGDWAFSSLDLPSGADDDPDLKLRFFALFSSAGDRMGFDDLALTGTLVPEPSTFTFLSACLLGGNYYRRGRRLG